MRYLYLYKCKPNYPVIGSAVLLFHSSIVPSPVHWPNLLIEGQKLAENAGFTYAGIGQSVIYLGQVDPIRDFHHLPVLLSENGEY